MSSQQILMQEVSNVIVTPTLKIMPDIGWWAGDIDQDDDVEIGTYLKLDGRLILRPEFEGFLRGCRETPKTRHRKFYKLLYSVGKAI